MRICKLLMLVSSVTLGLLLLSNCSGNENGTKTSIPKYEGMTISTSNFPNNVEHAKEVAKNSIYKYGENKNNELYKSSQYDDHQTVEDTLDNDLDDLISLDVIPDDEVKYYVEANETFIIQIHLSNPDQYEIQSFTLNGKKYSNYMFKDGSTMELLLLETTAPSEPGYIEYTIDRRD